MRISIPRREPRLQLELTEWGWRFEWNPECYADLWTGPLFVRIIWGPWN